MNDEERARAASQLAHELVAQFDLAIAKHLLGPIPTRREAHMLGVIASAIVAVLDLPSAEEADKS